MKITFGFNSVCSSSSEDCPQLEHIQTWFFPIFGILVNGGSKQARWKCFLQKSQYTNKWRSVDCNFARFKKSFPSICHKTQFYHSHFLKILEKIERKDISLNYDKEIFWSNTFWHVSQVSTWIEFSAVDSDFSATEDDLGDKLDDGFCSIIEDFLGRPTCLFCFLKSVKRDLRHATNLRKVKRTRMSV